MGYKIERVMTGKGFISDEFDVLERTVQKRLDAGAGKGWRLINSHIVPGERDHELEVFLIWETREDR